MLLCKLSAKEGIGYPVGTHSGWIVSKAWWRYGCRQEVTVCICTRPWSAASGSRSTGVSLRILVRHDGWTFRQTWPSRWSNHKHNKVRSRTSSTENVRITTRVAERWPTIFSLPPENRPSLDQFLFARINVFFSRACVCVLYFSPARPGCGHMAAVLRTTCQVSGTVLSCPSRHVTQICMKSSSTLDFSAIPLHVQHRFCTAAKTSLFSNAKESKLFVLKRIFNEMKRSQRRGRGFRSLSLQCKLYHPRAPSPHPTPYEAKK